MRIIERGRWSRVVRWAAIPLALSIYGSASYADAFLKIDDIEGESTTAGYLGWIDIESFSAGTGTGVSSSSGSTRTNASPQPDSVVVDKRLDASSPYLFLAAAKQTSLKSVVLESRTPLGSGGNTLLRYELSNASILYLDSSTESPKSALIQPIKETLAFGFEEWAMRYQRPGLDQVATSWNFVDGSGGLVGSDTPDVPQIDPFETLVSSPGEENSVKVTLSDSDTPAENLTLRAESLDPERVSIVEIEGSGAERTLTILVSDLFTGSASVALWVSDGFQTRSRTLSLSIEGGDTPYETFIMAAFGDALKVDGELASPIGDPDKDGLRTIAEFYLGTDPSQYTNSEDAIDVEQTLEGDELKTQLRYYRRTDTDALGGRILLSSNLIDWTDLGSESEPALLESSEQTDGPYERVTATLNLPVEEWENTFFRLRVDGAF